LLAVPLLMAGICLTIVVWDHFQRLNPIALVAAVLGLAAVIARLALTFGEHLRLLETTRAESLTDALTGLCNRRALLRRLDELSSQPTAPHLLLLFDLDGFKAYNDSFGHSVGDALLRRLGQRLRESVGGRGSAYRLGGDEFCILVEGDSVDLEWVRAAATASLRESGEGFTITCSSGHALIPSETESTNQALQLADRRMYAEKANTSGGRHTSRHMLIQALAERDGNLGQHTSAVADYASMLALEAGLDGSEAKLVRAAAELHDVGKLALPETLLSKPEPLDETEWTLVRKHTMIGERIIAAGEGLAEVAKIVRSTHERWDGTGYPDGLVGEQIPLEARLIAICDAYDAMTASRPYQPARTAHDASEELRRSAGSQFDPDLARLFIDHVLPALAASPARVGAADPGSPTRRAAQMP
jgi:two-component system, cell cycle response regulator